MAIPLRREYRSEDSHLPTKGGLHAEHVRDALWQGANDENDVVPYAREQNLIIVTSHVKDFGDQQADGHAGIVLLYDDTMPAYRVGPSCDGRRVSKPRRIHGARRTRPVGLTLQPHLVAAFEEKLVSNSL